MISETGAHEYIPLMDPDEEEEIERGSIDYTDETEEEAIQLQHSSNSDE